MATITQHIPGTFCWFELGTTDEAGAGKFYSSLFGWTDNSMPMDDKGSLYHMLQKDGKDIGAFYKLMPEMQQQGIPAHWMSYVSVESAANAAEKAKTLGGTVLNGPMDVMDVGRMAVIRDTTGGTVAVWEPLKHIGVGLLGDVGAQVWNELTVKDTAKARAFYTGLFAWTPQDMPMDNPTGGTFHYTIFNKADGMAAGMMPVLPGINDQAPPEWLVYFGVADTGASVKKAESLGAKILVPETPSPYGPFAVIQDPQGAVFAIIKLTPPQG